MEVVPTTVHDPDRNVGLREQGARLETRHRVRSVVTESAPRAPAATVTIARPGVKATARIVLAATAIRARRVATV
ncbi:hypothetical protein ABTD96_21160, partial [Acinetobacter baumannii]